MPDTDLMPETVMQGVSLFSKERRRRAQVFDLALTYDGIEIRRAGEAPRLLPWDRVSEWEIEQRRSSVLLTLRGGGSVTPLMIPHWRVDALDDLLRTVTSPPLSPLSPSSHEGATNPDVVESVADAPTPGSAPQPQPTFEEFVSQQLSPPREPAPQVEVATPLADNEKVAAESGRVDSVDSVDSADSAGGGLVWPSEAPLDEIPSLSWPSWMDQIEEVATTPTAFTLPPVVEAEPVAVAPAPIVIAPLEGAGSEPERVHSRVTRRRTARTARTARTVRFPFQTAVTVVLLALLATAVSLVLAQSAGLVHLAFLGSAA